MVHQLFFSKRGVFTIVALVFLAIVFFSRNLPLEHVEVLEYVRPGRQDKSPEHVKYVNPPHPSSSLKPASPQEPSKPQEKVNSSPLEDDDSQKSNHSFEDIYNSTVGFEHIFVVGLPSRSDRRDGIALGAGLSGLKIEFIDGVNATEMAEKAIIPTEDGKHVTGPALGAWRGHIDAIREVVVRNLTTALIMEDDMDWDIRLKDQLRDFAKSSCALTQPLQDSPTSYADPTFPHATSKSPEKIVDIDFDDMPATVPPAISPYGDNWDVLWLGHCGMVFASKDNKHISRGRVVHGGDQTVPVKNHLSGMPELVDQYPDHHRVVHHSQNGLCSLGYAVTQRGAQMMLHELGLKAVDTSFDLMLHDFCGGKRGGDRHTCLAIQPALFHHHRPVGITNAESDISNHGEAYRKEAVTEMVRWSVRLNADELFKGGKDFVDAYPD